MDDIFICCSCVPKEKRCHSGFPEEAAWEMWARRGHSRAPRNWQLVTSTKENKVPLCSSVFAVLTCEHKMGSSSEGRETPKHTHTGREDLTVYSKCWSRGDSRCPETRSRGSWATREPSGAQRVTSAWTQPSGLYASLFFPLWGRWWERFMRASMRWRRPLSS